MPPTADLRSGNTFRSGGTDVTYGTVLMLAAVPAWPGSVLRETASGRHVYAVGNNPEAARLTGIPTDRVLLGVYALAGVCLRHRRPAARWRAPASATRNAGQTENLDTITAVVLGGTSLFGGRGIDPGHAGRRADRRRLPQRPAR